MRRRTWVAVVVVVGSISIWLWKLPPHSPTAITGVIEADCIRPASRLAGRVAEVYVEEGSVVSAGQPLYRLEPFDLNLNHQKAQAMLSSRRAELARLKNGNRPEEIAMARANRDSAKARLDKALAGPRPAEFAIAKARVDAALAGLEYAQLEHQRLIRLETAQVASAREVNEAIRQLKTRAAAYSAATDALKLLEEGSRQEEIARARAELSETEAAFDIVKSGPGRKTIAAAQARVDEAEAFLEQSQHLIDELIVRAPCDCLVESISISVGELLAPEAPGASLLDHSKLFLRCYAPASRLALLRVNDHVQISIKALGKGSAVGQVTYIASQSEFTPHASQTSEQRRNLMYEVRIRLISAVPGLEPGMQGEFPLTFSRQAETR